MPTAARCMKPSAANSMSKIKRTLITFAVWLGVQIIALIAFPRTDSMMAPMLLTSDAAIILALWALKYFKVSDMFKAVPLKIFLASMVLGYASLYAVEIIQSQFDIPNILDDVFDLLVHSACGFVAICLIGPVMEELMMRRIILSEMREATGRNWIAILISAMLFSIMHGNPIQIVFALPAGILLGWLYCITGSLTVPICVHIMNNTLSFITMRNGADEPMSLSDPYTQIKLAAALLVTASMLIWMVGFYRRRKKVTEQ